MKLRIHAGNKVYAVLVKGAPVTQNIGLVLWLLQSSKFIQRLSCDTMQPNRQNALKADSLISAEVLSTQCDMLSGSHYRNLLINYYLI